MPSVTVQPTSVSSAITPYTGGTNRSTMTAWSSPSNATTEDGTNTTANGSNGTRWLVATDFKASGVALATTIAAGATISSITGRYKRQKTTGAGTITEAALVLRISSASKSNDMNDGSTWPGSLTDRTFTATFSGTTADVRDSTFGVSLAANHSTTATAGVDVVELTVTYLNPPILTATGSALAYTENDAATAVDSGITVTADVTNLTGATAQITTGFAAEDTLAFSTQNGITGSWDSGTGTMTLSGTATVAQYQTALRSITYVNSSDNPSTTTRVVTFGATDGTRSATSVTRSITIAAVNDAPVVTCTGSSLAYTQNDAATAVDSGLTVTDADSTNLASATVQITGNYASGSDVLAFSTQNGITGSWDASSGTMTLSGSATVANYQTAIRTVTFATSSSSTSTRTVTFIANDGSASSNSGTRTITVTAAANPAGPPVVSYIEWSTIGAAAALPRADAVLMQQMASCNAADYLMTDAGPVQVLSKNLDEALISSTAELIAAVSGKSIAVVSMVLTANTAMNVYLFDSVGAVFGGASGVIALGQDALTLEFNQHTWFRGAISSALSINISTGGRIGGKIQYVLI